MTRYPEKSTTEIKEMLREEVELMRKNVQRKIKEHDRLVDTFAEFLKKNEVDMAYEGLLQDKSTLNYMKWFQEELYTSDFIILIITESFLSFLSN